MMIEGGVIYCSCCGSEKMAELIGDNLVIKDRRHGEKHVAVIPVSSLLDILRNRNHTLVKKRAAETAKA